MHRKFTKRKKINNNNNNINKKKLNTMKFYKLVFHCYVFTFCILNENEKIK